MNILSENQLSEFKAGECHHGRKHTEYTKKNTRRSTDLYLWLSRIPSGPSMKFYVSSVHTMNELRLTGNSMKGSRPILVFDKRFDSELHWKVTKELLLQIFVTPKGHPRSKPFIDRTMSFMILDDKVWVRNYQIVFEKEGNAKKDDAAKGEPVLVEIGPRLVLHPIRIQQGAFCGSTIYQCPHFVNPNAKRRALRKQRQIKSAMYTNKIMKSVQRKERKEALDKKVGAILDSNPINDVFQKGIDFDFGQ